MASIIPLMTKLQRLIGEAYTDEEFGSLLYEKEFEFDYAGLPGKLAYKNKVQETVLWTNRDGQLPEVLRLAQIVAESRPKRKDLKKLVEDITAASQPAAPEEAELGGGLSAVPQSMSTELITALDLFATCQYDLQDLALDLRPKTRAVTYHALDLPGRIHLSPSEGERLVAILALEAAPDPAYLRWLSERVTVENPFPALIATMAVNDSVFP